MKKIIISFISILLSFLIVNSANATSLEKKYYKQIIITKTKIKNDYSSLYNDKIALIFAKYRYYKNVDTLTKLEVVLKDRILKLRSKNILTKSEDRQLNLYLNLFYRTKLLLDYQLK